MRIRDLLFALVFRSNVKKNTDDAKRLRLFGNAILLLFRPKSSLLSEDPSNWQTEVVAMYPRSPPIKKLRKIWSTTKGGCGYGDVWDVLREAAKSRDAYQSFILFTTAPRFLEIVVGGKAGAMAKRALESSLYKYSSRDIITVDTDTLLEEAEKQRVGNSLEERIREYCEVQEFRVRLESSKVNAGIFNHFSQYLAKKSGVQRPPPIHSMTTENVVEYMLQVEPLAEQYLNECEPHYEEDDKKKYNHKLMKVIDHASALWS